MGGEYHVVDHIEIRYLNQIKNVTTAEMQHCDFIERVNTGAGFIYILRNDVLVSMVIVH